MAAIPGSVRLTGFIAPSDSTDVYATHDALYGKDGLRSVANSTERDAITSARRRHGMLVFTQDTEQYWILNTDLTTWTELSTGGTPASSVLYEPMLGASLVNSDICYIDEIAVSIPSGGEVMTDMSGNVMTLTRSMTNRVPDFLTAVSGDIMMGIGA